MLFRNIALFSLAAAVSVESFVTPQPSFGRNVAISETAKENDAVEPTIVDNGPRDIIQDLRDSGYKAGGADTDFARRFGKYAGIEVKTVGETFAEFTNILGYTINPLYKNQVTDLVGTVHLITVNMRFQKDPVWSAGIMMAMNLLLKNYPEADTGAEIVTALFKAVGLDEAEIRAESDAMMAWADGKTREEVESALNGEGDSPLAGAAKVARGDAYWLYSRYFGLGLVAIMDKIGVEMDKDEVFPIMEDWMKNKLGKPQYTACTDSDFFFKVKAKLDMMETMMKEIEIREKKKQAERLEEKAEYAIQGAKRDAKLKAEVDKDREERGPLQNRIEEQMQKTMENASKNS